MQYAVTGKPAAPMPSRIAAWAIYDVFSVKDNAQIFLAVVSDTQWAIFCDAFGFVELKADPRLKTNNDRVNARDWLMPILRQALGDYSAEDLSVIFEKHGLPFAPITRPHDLLDDPHLNATGGLAAITLPDGRQTKTPLLPFTLDGQRPGIRLNPPKLGEHSDALLRELGYSDDAIQSMHTRQITR